MFEIKDTVLVKYLGNQSCVTIPDGVTEIGKGAFDNNANVVNVTIPNSVQRIGAEAFQGCHNLKKVTLPQSVTTIGDYAFAWCTKLQTIEIPANVSHIGKYAFQRCTKLQTVYWNATSCSSAGNVWLHDDVDMLIDDVVFAGCTALKKIIIGDNVTSIPKYAFYDCLKTVATLIIGKRVTDIGEQAFAGYNNVKKVCYKGTLDGWCNIDFGDIDSNPLNDCANLYINGKVVRTLIVPQTVTTLKRYTFRNCKNLQHVVASNNLSTIDLCSFINCYNLESVTLSPNIQQIVMRAFENCFKLSRVNFGGSLTDWCNISFGDRTANPLSYGADLYLNKQRVTTLTIPDTIHQIPNYVFSGGNFTDVIVHKGVTHIGFGAFDDSKRFTGTVIHQQGHTRTFKIKEHSSCIKAVYYEGTKEQWQEISIDYCNDNLRRNIPHYLSSQD